MKAIAYSRSLPISDPEALVDIQVPQPFASGQDLLIKVNAIAVNPVDYKIRQRVAPEQGEFKIIGWDAVGEVIAVGEQVKGFRSGDLVYYSGDLSRQGSNAEYQLVDERLVGHQPKKISSSDAAALPLTAITAWELLFEHLGIEQHTPGGCEKSDEIVLVIGAAGGVGSILIQLLKAMSGATVIATASRESSRQWVEQLGADHVIDHSQPLLPQIEALGIQQVSHIASLNSTETYFEAYPELLKPFGKIAMIDDPAGSLDVMKLKPKSQSLHIEFMFARSMFQTADMKEQGVLLNRVSELIDQGYIRTTVGRNLGAINAENLRQAHALLESGRSIGKIVLQGF